MRKKKSAVFSICLLFSVAVHAAGLAGFGLMMANRSSSQAPLKEEGLVIFEVGWKEILPVLEPVAEPVQEEKAPEPVIEIEEKPAVPEETIPEPGLEPEQLMKEPAPEAPSLPAKLPGESGEASVTRSDEGDRYMELVRRKIQAAKYYPRGAKFHRIEGMAAVRFEIREDGSPGAVKVETGSGSSVLDAAALRIVHKAAPFPPPPDGMENRTIEVDIEFRLVR